jgi:hypothetical protein
VLYELFLIEAVKTTRSMKSQDVKRVSTEPANSILIRGRSNKQSSDRVAVGSSSTSVDDERSNAERGPKEERKTEVVEDSNIIRVTNSLARYCDAVEEQHHREVAHQRALVDDISQA